MTLCQTRSSGRSPSVFNFFRPGYTPPNTAIATAGLVAIRQAERAGRRVPIVALTASVLEEDRARCLDAGMDDVLWKPISTEQLTAVLLRWAKPTERSQEPQEPRPNTGRRRRGHGSQCLPLRHLPAHHPGGVPGGPDAERGCQMSEVLLPPMSEMERYELHEEPRYRFLLPSSAYGFCIISAPVVPITYRWIYT